MPTDDERREVARRLRGLKDPYWAGDNSSEASMDVMGVESYLRRNGLSSNLADLIEPGEPKVKCVAEVKVDGERLEKLVHDAAVELTGIDQERLLAIATTMAADSVRSAKQGSSVSPAYILHAARNIAEACGETFGSIRNRELAKWGTSIVPKETIVERDALRGHPRCDAIGHAAAHEDDELWCEHCDIELDDSWRFCPMCGARIKEG